MWEGRRRTTSGSRYYTKVIIIALVGLVLLLPAKATTSHYYGQEMVAKENPEVTQKLWDEYKNKQSSKAASLGCNCVLYAQAIGLGIRNYGAAKNYPVNSMAPSDSGFVVTYEGPDGHMAAYIRAGDWLILDESNFVSCKITAGRRLRIGSPVIKGYINDL